MERENLTFSMALREYLFLPVLKYFSLALAHGTRSPAVNAPKYFSQLVGSTLLSIIF